MATLSLVILVCAPASLPGSQSPNRNTRPVPSADVLKLRLEALIKESSAEAVGVAFHDLESGLELLIGSDQEFHAASTMKIPVMCEVFNQAQSGKLSLDDFVPIRNRFTSIADNTSFSISAESDSEQTLYRRMGQTDTIRELTRLMITTSSNLATNLLIERLSAPNVTNLMTKMGATKTKVLRGVEDTRAFEQGLNNTTTAYDLMTILHRRSQSEKRSREKPPIR